MSAPKPVVPRSVRETGAATKIQAGVRGRRVRKRMPKRAKARNDARLNKEARACQFTEAQAAMQAAEVKLRAARERVAEVERQREALANRQVVVTDDEKARITTMLADQVEKAKQAETSAEELESAGSEAFEGVSPAADDDGVEEQGKKPKKRGGVLVGLLSNRGASKPTAARAGPAADG